MSPARAPSIVVAAACALCAREARAQRLPFGVSWRAGAVRGQVSGFAQGDYQLEQGSQSELTDDGRGSLQHDGFVLRRARVIATAETDLARLLLEVDGNTVQGPAFGVTQVEAMLRAPPFRGGSAPALSLAAGLLRQPFGRLNALTAREWGFFELPMFLRALFPGQSDVGVRASGALGWFRYDVAWTNGHPLGERDWSLRAPSGAGDLVGRLGVSARPTSFPSELSAGVSGCAGTGFHAGTPARPDVLVYRDVDQSGAFDPRNLVLVPGQPATASRTFARWGAALDVAFSARPLRAWSFTAFAEASYAVDLDRGIEPADPAAHGASARELGWVVGYVQTLFEHVVTGLRVEGYDPDADRFAAQNGRQVRVDASYFVATFHLAVALDESTLLGVEYTAVRDHLAIDASGRPTDLANDRFVARLQAGF